MPFDHSEESAGHFGSGTTRCFSPLFHHELLSSSRNAVDWGFRQGGGVEGSYRRGLGHGLNNFTTPKQLPK